MRTATYIIISSHEKWWIDLDGKTTGPFTNLEIAMATAVSMAAGDARAGERSEVRVSEAGRKPRIVYQSPAQGALARAGALAAATAST